MFLWLLAAIIALTRGLSSTGMAAGVDKLQLWTTLLIALYPAVITQSFKIPYSWNQFPQAHYRYSLRLRGGSSSSENEEPFSSPDSESEENTASASSEEDSKTRSNPISSFFRSILDWSNVAPNVVSDAPWDQGSDDELLDPPIPFSRYQQQQQRPSSLEHSNTGRGGALVHKPTTARHRLAHWLGPFDIGRVAPFADRLLKDETATVTAAAEQPHPTQLVNHVHGNSREVSDDDDETVVATGHDPTRGNNRTVSALTVAKGAAHTRRVWWHDLWTTTDDDDDTNKDATAAPNDQDAPTANSSLALVEDNESTNDESYQIAPIDDDEADDFDISDESDLDVVGVGDIVDNVVQDATSTGTNETRHTEWSPLEMDGEQPTPKEADAASAGIAAESPAETTSSPYVSSGAVRIVLLPCWLSCPDSYAVSSAPECIPVVHD
jgi:hypothetical protein